MPQLRSVFLRFAVVLLVVLIPGLSAQAAARAVRIGIVADGPWDRASELSVYFESEIEELLSGEFEVSFRDQDRIVGDWSLASVRAGLDALYARRDVDVVLALGVLASHDVARRGALSKPTIAPFVIDIDLQGLPQRDGRSGVRNLNYLIPSWGLEHGLSQLRKVVPFRKAAILGNPAFIEALPELAIKVAERVRERLGIEIEFIAVTEPVTDSLDALSDDVEAVYVVPLAHISNEAFDVVAAELIKRKLPSFSILGRSELDRGLMVGLTPESEWRRLARRVAINVQRALLGENPAEFLTEMKLKERLMINMATVRAIGKYPTWDVLTEAQLINDNLNEDARKLSLRKAVLEALDVNLSLAVEARSVKEGAEQVLQARSQLLPRLDLATQGTWIDDDRAEASFGSQAERSVSGGVTLKQSLYSDSIWTGYTTEKLAQRAREQGFESLELDIARDAAVGYLNVLRAKRFERIQKENLELTRSNLELAQTRRTIGAGGAGEVYRWESQIATNRQAVIDAQAERNVAEIALNRLLHRPLEEAFSTEDVNPDDSILLPRTDALDAATNDPWNFARFRSFLAEETLRNSPELAQLKAQIEAQRRVLKLRGRAFWLPDFALQGELEQSFDDSGAGTSAAAATGVATADDTDWSVGVIASIPLFTSGRRSAEERAALQTLAQLETQHAALAEQLEQLTRSAVHRTGASNAGIELSRAAADAATRNLELVQDSYSKGTVSIIDLLDAQNAALIADQNAATAAYDFLIDVVEAQRATGVLLFIEPQSSRDEFLARLGSFFARETSK